MTRAKVGQRTSGRRHREQEVLGIPLVHSMDSLILIVFPFGHH